MDKTWYCSITEWSKDNEFPEEGRTSNGTNSVAN